MQDRDQRERTVKVALVLYGGVSLAVYENGVTRSFFDLIKGRVHGMIEPSDPEYYNPLAPETTYIERSWDEYGIWANKRGVSRLVYRMQIDYDSYLRARGSNIPASTPNERDHYGNPLPDNLSDNIPCDDPACPPHVGGILTADVEAWADVWFYSNPIFIDVIDDDKYVASASK